MQNPKSTNRIAHHVIRECNYFGWWRDLQIIHQDWVKVSWTFALGHICGKHQYQSENLAYQNWVRHIFLLFKALKFEAMSITINSGLDIRIILFEFIWRRKMLINGIKIIIPARNSFRKNLHLLKRILYMSVCVVSKAAKLLPGFFITT